MILNFKKQWCWKRILVICLSIMISIGFISKSGMCGCRDEDYSPIPGFGPIVVMRECIFSNTDEFRKAPNLKEIEGDLGMNADKIPEFATDIYYLVQATGEDKHYFSLTLPHEEAIKFAEMLARVPISEFKDLVPGKTSYYEDIPLSDGSVLSVEIVSDSIIEGPKFRGKRWESPYWDLKNAKNGKYYKKKDELRFISIDLDTNRVYFCKWTT